MAALRNLLPRQTKVMRAGSIRQIEAAELAPGDVILLTDGDIVPADCHLPVALGVRVNIAAITGESLSRVRNTERSTEDEMQNSQSDFFKINMLSSALFMRSLMYKKEITYCCI